MSQNAENVVDHFNLFRSPEYVDMFKTKKENFENAEPVDRVEEIRDWTKTWDYREKNFARDMDMAINSPVWSLTKTPWK